MRRIIRYSTISALLMVVTICTTFVMKSASSPSGNHSHIELLLQSRNDFRYESNSLISNSLYRRPKDLYNPVESDGASNANITLKYNPSQRWFIEEQRYGEERIAGGLIKNDAKAIKSGLKMFEWGFKKQADDGSFIKTADGFHSTSFFVQAVSRSLLLIQQSSQSKKYASEVESYKQDVHRAARWMIRRSVWEGGIERNQPYAHRRYLVAAALGLTGKLTNDQKLINYARKSIEDGLALQRPDGVNPEKDGYDSSYQVVGVVYAQRWLTYFSNDPLAPRVKNMINKALSWEQTRILPTGEINREGNTRTSGQEISRTTKVKTVSHRMAIRAFAYWASVTGEQKWADSAQSIAQYYYKNKIRSNVLVGCVKAITNFNKLNNHVL